MKGHEKLKSLFSFTHYIVTPCIFLLTIFTVLSFLGEWNPWFGLLCHFRMHYVLLWVVVGIWILLWRRYRWLILPLLGIVINAVEIIPLYKTPARLTLQEEPAEVFSIASINLLQNNQEYASVEAYIREKDPDLVALVETTPLWARQLKEVSDTYPFQQLIPLHGYYGIMLLSRFPIDSSSIWYLIQPPVPTLYARCRIGNQRLHLIVSHPPSPPSMKKIRWRNETFRQIGRNMSELGDHRMIIGDLNMTSFSPVFKSLISETDLFDSRIGWGRQASWPSRFGLGGIALDHALLSSDISVLHRETGKIEGSDHRPIFLHLALKQIHQEKD